MLKKYRGPIIFFYCLSVVLLIIAIFSDLKIDIALNSPENPIADWFQRTGEMPSRLICPIAGAILVFCSEKAIVKIIGLVVNLGGSAYLGYYIAEYFFIDQYKNVFGIIWGIGFGLVLLLTFKYIKIPNRYKKVLMTIAVIAVLVLAAELIITSGIKLIWGRVRFRDLLAEGSYDSFTAWYKPNGANGNNSFPSGHTASAAMSYLIMFLPYITKKWKDKTQLCFWCPFVYTYIVAFTRLVMGAHYLSDVTFGAIIGVSCVLVGLKVFESLTKKHPEMKIN